MSRLTYQQAKEESADDLLAIIASGENPRDGTKFELPVEVPQSDAAIFSGAHTTHATLGTSSEVRPANAARKEITVVNDSDTVVYLHLGGAGGALNAGIRLNANGGSWSSTKYRGAIRSICSVASKTLTVVEV